MKSSKERNEHVRRALDPTPEEKIMNSKSFLVPTCLLVLALSAGGQTRTLPVYEVARTTTPVSRIWPQNSSNSFWSVISR